MDFQKILLKIAQHFKTRIVKVNANRATLIISRFGRRFILFLHVNRQKDEQPKILVLCPVLSVKRGLTLNESLRQQLKNRQYAHHFIWRQMLTGDLKIPFFTLCIDITKQDQIKSRLDEILKEANFVLDAYHTSVTAQQMAEKLKAKRPRPKRKLQFFSNR